jgi:hypothetical protein
MVDAGAPAGAALAAVAGVRRSIVACLCVLAAGLGADLAEPGGPPRLRSGRGA